MAGQSGINIRSGREAQRSTRWWRKPRYLVLACLVLLLVVMAMSTTYVDADSPRAGAVAEFDPETYGAELFPEVTAAIEASALDLPDLLAALAADEETASEQYGNRGGVASPYSFPVRGTGFAGQPESGMLPVDIEGLPEDVSVQIQIGPVLRGTTLRDTVDFVHFDQFVNQLEYADAARALNSQVLAQTLSGFDADAAAGTQVSFLGAFTLLSPSVVTITPVRLEVGP